MKAHIGVDADSGLVHTVIGTSGHVADITEGNQLLHGKEKDAFGDAGYQGITKRADANKDVTWHVAMRPGKRKALDKENNPIDALVDKVEKIKVSIRAKVEHPFRVIKRQFGYVKVRYREINKKTLQLKTLFALSNLCMVRRQLLGGPGMSAPEIRQWDAKSAQTAAIEADEKHLPCSTLRFELFRTSLEAKRH